MAKSPLPPGHHAVTPSFIVPRAAEAIAWLERVVGARVVDRYDGPNGMVMHAEVQIGDAIVMCGDPQPEWPAFPGLLTVYVDDGPAVDATYAKAVAEGGRSVRAPENQFYGHRVATVDDPFGNRWTFAAVIEAVSQEEMHRRMEAMK